MYIYAEAVLNNVPQCLHHLHLRQTYNIPELITFLDYCTVGYVVGTHMHITTLLKQTLGVVCHKSV